jgi:quercetin dioxygenase-like cupin family protein
LTLASSIGKRKALAFVVTETADGGIVRLPGDGETTSLFGDTYAVKAAGEETGGALAVIEASLAPHSGGTPLHVNTLEDENYYVVEGTLTFRLGERTLEAPAGTFVHIPKGVVHTHWNATAAPVRLLGIPAPAGFETFFADLAQLMAGMPPGPPDMSRMAAVYEKYGLRVVGPPPSSDH